jgi:hypothetical protein
MVCVMFLCLITGHLYETETYARPFGFCFKQFFCVVNRESQVLGYNFNSKNQITQLTGRCIEK